MFSHPLNGLSNREEGPLTRFLARFRVLDLINRARGGLDKIDGNGLRLELVIPGKRVSDDEESLRSQFTSPMLGALARSLQIIDEMGGDADPFVVMQTIRQALARENNFGLSQATLAMKFFPTLGLLQPKLVPPMMSLRLLDPRAYTIFTPKSLLRRVRDKLGS